jgi:hypothetical protein
VRSGKSGRAAQCAEFVIGFLRRCVTLISRLHVRDANRRTTGAKQITRKIGLKCHAVLHCCGGRSSSPHAIKH